MSEEYHKINSVFMRDPADNFRTFLFGQYADPALEYLAGAEWVGTEKIDGTNIRVMWDGVVVRFARRTDSAQLPPRLLSALQEHFTPERMHTGTEGPLTLYGEGFGGKIQKGGNYRKDEAFILFDAFAGGVFLQRDTLADLSFGLGIPLVPEVFRGTLSDAVAFVKGRPRSLVAQDAGYEMEGLVLRPAVELADRMGRRIITKLKARDFPAPALKEREK